MGSLLVGLLLLAQTGPWGLPSYTLVQPDGSVELATAIGRFLIQLEEGCDGYAASQTVVVYQQTNTEALLGDGLNDPICNVVVGTRIQAPPCATNSAGLCDLALDSGGE